MNLCDKLKEGKTMWHSSRVIPVYQLFFLGAYERPMEQNGVVSCTFELGLFQLKS
jgi:hypothetical protein